MFLYFIFTYFRSEARHADSTAFEGYGLSLEGGGIGFKVHYTFALSVLVDYWMSIFQVKDIMWNEEKI